MHSRVPPPKEEAGPEGPASKEEESESSHRKDSEDHAKTCDTYLYRDYKKLFNWQFECIGLCVRKCHFQPSLDEPVGKNFHSAPVAQLTRTILSEYHKEGTDFGQLSLLGFFRNAKGRSRMKRFLQTFSIGLLLLVETSSNCYSASTEVAPPLLDVISAQVPTLEVLSDSCYVFDEPRINPYYFGPLRKGEWVKWLDAQDGWIDVWIPRLKISGWVRGSHVYEAEQTDPTSNTIPAKVFTKVVVTARSANIRSEARAQAQPLLIARKGEDFWLLNEKGGWCLVWLSDLNRTGWVFGKVVWKQKPN